MFSGSEKYGRSNGVGGVVGKRSVKADVAGKESVMAVTAGEFITDGGCRKDTKGCEK